MSRDLSSKLNKNNIPQLDLDQILAYDPSNDDDVVARDDVGDGDVAFYRHYLKQHPLCYDIRLVVPPFTRFNSNSKLYESRLMEDN